MSVLKITAVIAGLCCLNGPATAAMFVIENPAGQISNPAATMDNPAPHPANPATNVYHPVAATDNRKVPTLPAATEPAPPAQPVKAQPELKQKKYHLKSVKAYIAAAKRSFVMDDYAEFIAVTEEALRRIDAGTLKVTKQSEDILVKYRVIGYVLLGEQRGPVR